MKRALLSGLFFALITGIPINDLAEWALVLNALYPLPEFIVIQASDYNTYSMLERIASYEHLTALLIGIQAGLAALVIILFKAAGWFKLLKGEKSGKFRYSSLLILFPSVAAIYLAYKLSFALKYDQEVAYFLMSFCRPDEAFKILTVFLVPKFTAMFLMGTSTYVIIKSRSLDEAVRGIGAVSIAMVLFLSSVAVTWVYRDSLDIGMNLLDIPGVTEDADELVFLPLDGGTGALRVETEYRFDDRQNAPYSRANVAAVERYLDDADYSTALRLFCMDYLFEWYMLRMDKEAACMESVEIFRKIGNPIDGKMAFAMAGVGPYTERRFEAFDEFVNDGSLIFSCKPALIASRSYARYGRLKDARIWYDRGTQDTECSGEELAAKYAPPEVPPFYDGVVEGRVLVQGADADEIRLGIFTAEHVAKFRSTSAIGKVSARSLAWTLGGTVLPADGSFTFTGLGAGEYVLLLSLPDADGKAYTVTGSPGVITISEDAPNVDVGEVRLALDPK